MATAADIALIVGVKDNRPTPHQKIQEVSATTAPLGSAHSHDKGRNRDERRTVSVFDPADKLADTGWHPHVVAIVRVERSVYTRNADRAATPGAVAKVVEIGWWRSLWFVQRTISGVSAPAETTPRERLARRRKRTARHCLQGTPGLTRCVH